MKIKGEKIVVMDSIKYFWIWFDKNNTFYTNTISVIKRTNKKASAIRYIFIRISGCNMDTAIEVYKSHIRALMEYDSIIRSEISECNKRKLESLQHKVLCCVIGKHPRSAIKNVLKYCQLTDLKTQREILLLKR